MASMDDLIATISGGMQVGQQANDLKDLHAKLAETLHPNIPPYRPIPPSHVAQQPPHSAGPMPPPAPASSWNDPPPGGSHLFSPGFSGGMGNSPRQTGRPYNPSSLTNNHNPANSLANSGGSPAGVMNGFAGGVSSQMQVPTANSLSNAHANNNVPFVGQRETGFVPIPRGDSFSTRSTTSFSPSNSGGSGSGSAGGYPGRMGIGMGQMSGNDGLPYHTAVLPIKASPKDTGGFAEDAFRPLWDERQSTASSSSNWRGFSK